MLLNFLNIRVVVNGHEIFPIAKGEKLVIPVYENNPRIVATDGYHITQPLELVFHHIHTYRFKVVCVIGDSQLLAGIIFLILMALIGLLTGFLLFKLMSILPILYFLFLYYINRKEFIQISAT